MSEALTNEWTIDDYANHYVETIAKPPNAYGQHISDIFGQSHAIMYAMVLKFGAKETCDIIDACFGIASPR